MKEIITKIIKSNITDEGKIEVIMELVGMYRDKIKDLEIKQVQEILERRCK